MEDMVDMELDTLAMLATMVMDWDILIMESVRLKLSPRLLPTPTCTGDTMDMVLDMDMDILVLDTMVLDTEFMASVRLSLRLMLIPTFCMEDMDTLDMPDTMDIPMVDMPTMDKLFPLISKWTANHPCFLYQ